MSDSGGSGGGGNDLLWFLGIIAMLFLAWMMTGGPQRANQNINKPTVGPPGGPTSPQTQSPNQNPTGGSMEGEIRVEPIN